MIFVTTPFTPRVALYAAALLIAGTGGSAVTVSVRVAWPSPSAFVAVSGTGADCTVKTSFAATLMKYVPLSGGTNVNVGPVAG